MTHQYLAHIRSSRWDRTTDSLQSSLSQSRKELADVVLLTEVADGKRPDALRIWCQANGWDWAQDRSPWQSGETAIIWNAEEAKCLNWETVSIGPDLGPGLPLVATVAILEFKDGTKSLYGMTHLPSSVEGDWRQRGRRVVEYQKAVRRYRKAVTKYRKRYHPDFELVCADWNLNVLLKWVKRYLKINFPKHRLVQAGNKGTHGHRQIDAALVRFKPKYKKHSYANARVLDAHYSSDHKGVEVFVNVNKA